MIDAPWIIPLLPLIAFALNGLLRSSGRNKSQGYGWLSTGLIFGSFIATVLLWISLDTRTTEEFVLYRWIASGGFNVEIAFLTDELTVVMLLVVTGISTLVSMYATGYMSHDANQSRFFTWIPLFVFSMIMLVISDNLLQLFVFWEMVGLCSYLLIGYWYQRNSANAAATKAFLVNRVGDFGFAIGIILAFHEFGTVRYREIFENLGKADERMLTAIALLLFVGAMGKSAQFPLHIWLPDAMEGPTPVSALIHAATMVTAGVYLVVRLNPLYTLAPQALLVIAATGTFTAFMAATIALVQTDIKRVLAYSTVSQLGLMFLAIGSGAYTVAIFHLATHAFFKALLFLGSGSVIHALQDEQDMRQMGGLWRKLPLTYTTFLLGGLALAAIFPLAGFWSKDEVLAVTFVKATAPAGSALSVFHGAAIYWLFYITGLAVSIMTAAYTFRMIFKTFHGTPRNPELHAHAHESPWIMTVPLIILTIGATGAGALLGIPPENGLIHGYLKEAAPIIHLEGAAHPNTLVLALISTLVAGSGLLIAFGAYGKGLRIPLIARTLLPGAETLFKQKWYMDHLGDRFTVALTKALAFISWGFDVAVVDGIVNGLGSLTQTLSGQVRRIHTGQAQNYALLMVIGMVLTIGGLVLFR